MKNQKDINYYRIAQAIEYLRLHFKKQPDLDEIARKIHLSPFHFQRLFTKWAGVSPKKFLQFLNVEYAKNILKSTKTSLLDVAHQTGLSSTGRLHDLFVKIEGMTPREFKDGGKNLVINYSYHDGPFGNVLIASTKKGVCYLAFSDNQEEMWREFCRHFPQAQYQQKIDSFQQKALAIFNHDWSDLKLIKLHLKGTNFQLKVWQALLRIPFGDLSTYGEIASQLKNPKASRAVGSAVGSNPVAFLIPCHRVIRSSGIIGNYHWGSVRKMAMIGWEGARKDFKLNTNGSSKSSSTIS